MKNTINVKLSSLIFILLFFIAGICNANTNWTRVTVNDLASFKIPPTMEVQSKEYRNIVRAPELVYGRLICQQAGLNQSTLNYQPAKYYARAIFTTTFIGEDSGMVLGQPLQFTKQDLDDFTSEFIRTQRNLLPPNYRILEVSNAKIIRVPIGECIYVTYKRQLDNNPIVIGHHYFFYHKDKAYNLNVGYRVQESSRWCSPDNDLRKIVETLYIH